MSSLQPFHLAVPVHDLAAARQFYGGLLGCPEGRSSPEWVDFDFFGHQLVAHLDHDRASRSGISNVVDGKEVPVPHFGVVLEWDHWHRLAETPARGRRALRHRARHPLPGPGGGAGDDVFLRSGRQRTGIQGIPRPVAIVREVGNSSAPVLGPRFRHWRGYAL